MYAAITPLDIGTGPIFENKRNTLNQSNGLIIASKPSNSTDIGEFTPIILLACFIGVPVVLCLGCHVMFGLEKLCDWFIDRHCPPPRDPYEEGSWKSTLYINRKKCPKGDKESAVGMESESKNLSFSTCYDADNISVKLKNTPSPELILVEEKKADT